MAQTLRVNELCAKNENLVTDPDFHQFSDWIELYNSSASSIDLEGYSLTDDPANPIQWVFPAGSSIGPGAYLLIWADGENSQLMAHHSNFKLSNSGESVSLYSPGQVLLSTLEYGDFHKDISYGIDASETAVYFHTPSPGALNQGPVSVSYAREPELDFSISSGHYPQGVSLSISCADNTAQIYYSTDGSNPNPETNLYTGPIALSGFMPIRARAYGQLLPSKTAEEVYLIDISHSLPISSLIIEPDFLWSPSIGIFNEEDIALRTSWERSASLQYLEGQSLNFNKEIEIQLFGSSAWELPQKSFSVKFDNPLDQALFSLKQTDMFHSINLRSSSDDWTSTMMRDGFIQSLIHEELGLATQLYQPSVLYVNGDYFGIQNLREKYNEDYFESNYGIAPSDLEYLKLNYWGLGIEAVNGSDARYLEMLDYLDGDMSDNAVFAGVADYIDLDDYSKYVLSEIFIGNRSYNHNVTAWRRTDIEAPFRWAVRDTDRGYLDPWREILALISNSDPVLRRLLLNQDYEQRFIQQLCSMMNGPFRPHRVADRLDTYSTVVAGEMPDHIDRWGPTGGLISMNHWNTQLAEMRSFSQTRKDTLISRLDSTFNLEGTVNLTLKKTPASGGKVEIAHIEIPYSDSIHTYFKQVPMELVARANPGYSFVSWGAGQSAANINLSLASDTTITALFEPICSVPSVVSTDMAFVLDCSPYYLDYDITVAAGATLSAEPGVEINFSADKGIIVEGSLELRGDEVNPIQLQGEDGAYWSGILVSGTTHLEHVVLRDGVRAVYSYTGAIVDMHHCSLLESMADEMDLCLFLGSEVRFTHNTIYGEPTNTKRDAVDTGYLSLGHFSDNTFYNVSDDCIDSSSSQDLMILRNTMESCQSMGISLGEGSTALAQENIILHSSGGIQVHSGASIWVVNNTLHNLEEGIKAYHYDTEPLSGGEVHVLNTIFSDCDELITQVDNSVVNIAYSLSSSTALDGEQNLVAEPYFVSTIDDVHLRDISPCIDQGDPLSGVDPDGSTKDLGALYYDGNSSGINLEVDEVLIYPNPSTGSFNIIAEDYNIIARYQVYDLQGKLIRDRAVSRSRFEIELKDRGFYLIRLELLDGTNLVRRMIKQ